MASAGHSKWKETMVFLEDREEIEAKANKPMLKLITGGKEPPDENWLEKLALGTIFLARPKKNLPQQMDYMLIECHILYKADKSSNLQIISPGPEGKVNVWVDNLRFSRTYDWIETLTVVIPIESSNEDKENTNPEDIGL